MALSPQEDKKIPEILKFFVGAMKGMTLYPPGHPSVHKPLVAMLEMLNSILRVLGKISITTMEGILIVAERPFYDTNIQAKELLDRFGERNIANIEIIDGVVIKEFEILLSALKLDPKKLEQVGGLARFLKDNGAVNIIVSNAKQVYDSAIVAVEHVLKEARLGRIPNSDEAIGIVEDMKETVLNDKGAIVGLTMIKSYDDYLFNHSVNVSVLSIALAEELGVPREHLNDIGLGGLLHDIGKVHTPKEIVHKPSKLDPDEWKVMREHPIKSYEIVSQMKGISEITMRIVYEHHVHYDYKGYPPLEEGQQTHKYSQMVSVADTYDAMTTLRTYQKAHTPKEALDIMEKRLVGKAIDPSIFDVFVKLLGIYPVGTLVRLDTNEIALVIDVKPANFLLPKVKIVLDPVGRRLPDPVEVDLGKIAEEGGTPKNIVSTVDPLLANIDTTQYL